MVIVDTGKMAVSRSLFRMFALSLAMLLSTWSALSYSYASMTYEDFTSYTEVEPDDRIQKTATHVDILTIKNEDTYLYKDKGADHFKDFEHLIDVKCVNASENYAFCAIWIVSNDVDDALGQRNSENKLLTVEFYRFDYFAPVRRIILGYWDGGDWHTDIANFAFDYGTWYYFRIKRRAGALTCKIYDSAENRDQENLDEHLLDTLSLEVGLDDNFRYIYAGSSYNIGITPEMNCDIENLFLQEMNATPSPVGDIWIPVGLVLTVLVATVATAIYVMRRKTPQTES